MTPKECTLCHTQRQILVRCQTDESRTWHFVCPGKCWHAVSGGVEDARGLEGRFPFYRYGGMWKDRDADGPLSAKKPRKVKERQRREAGERDRGGEERGENNEEGSGVESAGAETQSQDPKDATKAGESVLD